MYRVLTNNWRLTWELAKRDVSDRYVGQMLGSIWSLAHPIFLMALYVFIFTTIFPARFDDLERFPRSYTVYILSGLVPWLTFQEVLHRSVVVITQNASLVKQIVFPIEVLPVKTVLGSFASQIIATVVLALVCLVFGDGLNWWWLGLPVLWALSLLAMTGASYLLAALGVYIRDLKDVLQVFVTANLFLQPILFTPDRIPESLRFLLYLNPFSYLTWCYQDLLYYGRIEHPFAWICLLILSVLIAWCGVATFNHLKHWFGDVL